MWLPALLLALTITSHLVVAIFAVLAGVVLWLIRHPVRNFTRVAAVGAVGVAAHRRSGSCRSLVNLGNTTDMRYEPTSATTSTGCSCPRTGSSTRSRSVALGAGIWYRRRATLDRRRDHGADGPGLLQLGGARAISWARRRPGTCGCCRSGTSCSSCSRRSGVAELARLAALGVAWVVKGSDRARPDPALGAEAAPEPHDELVPSAPAAPHRRSSVVASSRNSVRVIAIAVLAVVATTVTLVRVQQTRAFLPVLGEVQLHRLRERHAPPTSPPSRGPSTRPSSTPRTRLPPGRMVWEGGDAIGAYGTPLALMLLPVLDPRADPVDGGAVLRGVDDDAVPLHDRRDARAVAVEPGAGVAVPLDHRLRPRRAVPAADGRALLRRVHRRGEGRPAANRTRRCARSRPCPTSIGKPPNGWTIYRVADSPTVQALRYQPVVVDDLQSDAVVAVRGRSRRRSGTPTPHAEFSPWECTAVPWFDDPAALDRPLTDGGPASLGQRADSSSARSVAEAAAPRGRRSRTSGPPSPRSSFDVSRTGVPVMVKTSYYPELEGRGRRRAVAGHAQLHGGRAHQPPREADVRHRHGRLGRAGADRGRGARSRRLVWWGTGARPATADDSGVERRRRRVRFPSRSRR